MTNEEKILEMLGTMQEDLTRVNDRLGRLETTQGKMQAAQDKMQEDLTRVNDRLGRLETTQDKMQATQDKMQAAQDKMQKDLDTVKTTQAQMQATQDKMQEDITRINVTLEVKIAKEIQILADGHMGITEQLHKLDDIEKKLEDVSIRADSAHAAAVVNEYEITQLKQVR